MMSRLPSLGLALLAATALFVAPAFADPEADVMNQIETLQGDSAGFGEFFGAVQDAFMLGGPADFAQLLEYPVTITANGETYDVQSADDFLENLDTLITKQTADTLQNQNFADLFVNSDGVMFGDGAAWASNICDDNACTTTHWAIVSINN